MAPAGHTELNLSLLVCRWLHSVLRPHGSVSGLHCTPDWSLVFVKYTTVHCRSLFIADTMHRSLFSADTMHRSLFSADTAQRSLFSADPSGLGSLFTTGVTNLPDASQLRPPCCASRGSLLRLSQHGALTPTRPSTESPRRGISWRDRLGLRGSDSRGCFNRSRVRVESLGCGSVGSNPRIQTSSVVLRRHGLVLLTVAGSSKGVSAAGSRNGCLALAPKPDVGARRSLWKRGRFWAHSRRSSPNSLGPSRRSSARTRGNPAGLRHKALAQRTGSGVQAFGSGAIGYTETTGPRPYIQGPGHTKMMVFIKPI